MKHVAVISGVVAAIVATAVIGLVGVGIGADNLPSRNLVQEPAKVPELFDQKPGTGDTRTTSYEKVQADAYEFEIPTGWQFQPQDALLDSVVDTIITEATNGRIHDNRFYQYAESESLETDLAPTSIQLLTAKSDLAQREYEDAMYEISSFAGLAAGMDLRLIDNRQDSLGGRPAVTLVDVMDSGLPTIKTV